MESALEKIDGFSRSKKNMHPPIRGGIQEAKKELGALRYNMEDTLCYLDSFEYLMRGLMVKKIKEVRPRKNKEVADEGSQTLPQPAARSTPETRKRVRELTASPEVSVAKKPAEKRPKASNKEEEYVEVLTRKNLQKRKRKKARRTPKRHSHARPEAVLMKPVATIQSYGISRSASTLINKGAKVQGIRETHSKHLLVKLKCSKKDRERLDTAFKEAVGINGAVCHLISRIEVEISE